ncbi:hypothetical protein [Marinitenerispora sediminis]|nr:hypothetical protein [Marinitenerispora sediminis]
MGALGISELIAFAVIMSVPVSLVAGGVVYVVRLARRGPEATLRAAVRRR